MKEQEECYINGDKSYKKGRKWGEIRCIILIQIEIEILRIIVKSIIRMEKEKHKCGRTHIQPTVMVFSGTKQI